MATFRVPVVRIKAIEPISNADSIEIAVVEGYNSVVRKGIYATGDLVVYLPESALLPDSILIDLDMYDEEKKIGKLSGSKGNRIKAVKLRGVLSQGIIYRPHGMPPVEPEGTDMAEILGVTKYEPEIPTHFSGKVVSLHGHLPKYDIENRKNYPNLINEGEEVVYAEKIHGTSIAFGCIPLLIDKVKKTNWYDLFYGGNVYVSSKGFNASGLVFSNVPENYNNLYVKMILDIPEVIGRLVSYAYEINTPIHVKAEVFGAGVQDLTYGLKEPKIRGFDVYFGSPGNGRWLSVDEKIKFFKTIGLQMVDILYRGPFTMESLMAHCDGPTVTGAGANIREGVVITPTVESYVPEIGRVFLKEVSAAYLTRKGQVTEFN